MDQPAHMMEADHPPRAFGYRDKIKRIGRLDRIEPDAMHGSDLRGLGDKLTLFGPYHDRSNEIAGTGRIVVEQAQHVIGPQLQAQFLVQLAQRRHHRRLALVAASAGQRPLTAMGAQARGTQGQQQRRSVNAFRFDEHDGDRGPLQRRPRSAFGQPRKRCAALCNIPPCGFAEWPHHPA